MPAHTYEVRVVTTGRAYIYADTKREADERARRGDFDQYSLSPPHAEISTLKKREDPS